MGIADDFLAHRFHAVDGPISEGLATLIDMTVSMLMKLAAVVLFTPFFVIPGVLMAVVGGYCGQIYIKAQLSVKREMSVARAPVLGHFGAAMAGLGERINFSSSKPVLTMRLSVHSCIRRSVSL